LLQGQPSTLQEILGELINKWIEDFAREIWKRGAKVSIHLALQTLVQKIEL
jgi:hypothetical protein